MTIIEDRLAQVMSMPLSSGGHASLESGACVMEAVAFVAGEPWSDHPQCSSPVLGAFCRSFNDHLDDEGRQRLASYIPRLVGTNTGVEDERKRGWLIADWMTHVHLPTWLDAAGMSDQAAQVRALPKIESAETLAASRKVIRPLADAAWEHRRTARAALSARVKAAVTDALKKKRDVDVDVAVAVAVDVAAAVAVDVDAAAAAAAAVDVDVDVAAAAAAAAAAAVAVDVAVAVAVDVAAAVAVDVDAAAAVAVDAAAAAAAAAARRDVWSAVYDAVKPIYRKAIEDDPKVGPVALAMKESGFELLDALCAIGR